MRPHNWISEESIFRLFEGKTQKGAWHECSECKYRIFVPEGYSDFQRRLTGIIAFINEISGVEAAFRNEQDVVEYKKLCNRFNVTGKVGLHAILARDCDSAKAYLAATLVASVMNS
jgi:hypothetical protein